MIVFFVRFLLKIRVITPKIKLKNKIKLVNIKIANRLDILNLLLNYNIYIMKNRAFTLLEAVIVLILISSMSLYLVKLTNLVSSDFFVLKSQTEYVKKSIETARERAVLGDKGQKWGVIFFNTTTKDYFYTFAGDTFETATSSEKNFIDKSLNFINIPLGSSSEIIFSKFNGELTASSSIIINAPDIEKSYKITISKYGTVNFELQ